MSSTATPSPRYHVLLTGIDAYKRMTPLSGSVNDIDAVEAILIDRLGVPAGAITKLASPHPWHDRRRRLPEQEATSKNLRMALERLAGDAIQQGDRVLVYYAGHGTQELSDEARVAREALVPVDLHAGGELLYDYELNGLLRRIASRSGDLTVVLDCCCSAGATRDAVRPAGSAVRFCPIEPSALPAVSASRRPGAAGAPEGLLSSLDPSDPGYLVAAACQSNEPAQEGPGDDGLKHGGFTAALLQVLGAYADSRLETLRWADVWQAVRQTVLARYPGQHPWLIGRAERRLFGGPFRRQDPGYPVVRDGDRYCIAAGTMVGLTRGAKVAVYGSSPDRFPRLGSHEDLAARIGVLKVDTASPSSCTATPAGTDFAITGTARGRLIAPGERDALVVQLHPYDATLATWLQRQGGLCIVRAADAATKIEEAFVGIDEGGKRWIGDELYGASTGPDAEPPLVQVERDDREALLAGLVHYAGYNLALRLVRRCRDLPGALGVRVLDCRDMAALAPADLQDPPLREVRLDPRHRYRYVVAHGQAVCVAVENKSSERLYANLINCAASGRVEILGGTQIEIPAEGRQTFWLGGRLGQPFRCSVPEGRASGVDRLIAVATTVADVDLSFLRQSRSFEQAIEGRCRDMASPIHEPSELWTAALVTLKITRTLAGSP